MLGRLAAVAVEWVRKVTRALALGDDFAEMSRATIQTFGSYRLGVHGPGAAVPLFLIRIRIKPRVDAATASPGGDVAQLLWPVLRTFAVQALISTRYASARGT